MSIQVSCPRGHALKVSDAMAGKVGLCPICKARVRVPQVRYEDLSEDAIMGFLGERGSPGAKPAKPEGNSKGAETQTPHERTGPPKKICQKCNEEISAGTHICPFCHTYIASLRDFS